ncbi:MAG: ABC transporter permease [Sulfuricurvum sp.]|jgi:phospholipid/cholesterol/gamma-HCH transport system permease protein|uniref:MlaE family ABC transporter permease n=1 Tax=Sulfuricurvum sp. TaxID=2025608 RepID=UPI0025EC30ED|nr:ABC transporter permease [Sulfuricurvum sp.]MCK9373233.1 ABC transporter permease [Sulfuricurvum sp.]
MVERLLSFVGRPFLNLYDSVEKFGTFILFQLTLFKLYPHVLKRPKILLTQIEVIGFGCMGVVTLTALFTGMVEAIQLYSGLHQFGVDNFIGYTIFLSITKELGPVFASLMLISRSISAMAAELGTMRVSEQIDAIDILGVNSKEYLITPRIVATVISLPLLVIWFDFIAISAAYLISTHVLGINPNAYQETLSRLGEFNDILTGVIKAAVFGFIVSSIGSYIGYHTAGGARGVGESTIYAVVYSAVAIFVANYFLSSLFLYLDW